MLRRLLAFITALVLVSWCVTAASASTTRGSERVGNVPRAPAGARVVGTLPDYTWLRVTIALKPRDPAGLAAYAAAVSDPASPDYHHYLSVAQFARRFGASPQAVAGVRAWLGRHGLSPGPITPNRLSFTVTATAGRFARSFSTSFRRIVLRGGRTTYANVSAPALGASIARYVQAVVGLDDLAHAHPLYRLRARPITAPHAAAPARSHAAGAVSPCLTASTQVSQPANAGSYTIDQIASAYDFGGLYAAGDLGAGTTVAIYELEGNFPSDIAAYQSCFGTDATVSYQQVDGGPPSPTAYNYDGIETELDVENLIGLAPRVHVIVYQGPNTTQGGLDTYEAMISAGTANVLQTSWGACEPNAGLPAAQAEATLFQEAAVQGQTVVAAAGDTGAQDCYGQSANTVTSVDDPASQPFVTGVGGTTLSPTSPHTETVWNNGPRSVGGAGGGGNSSFWAMPAYQSSAPPSLNVINSQSSASACGAPPGSYCREVPDVSADADVSTGYLIYWNGDGLSTDSAAWLSVAGTSGAAPVWAGVFAETDSLSTCSGPVGFANPKLYSIAVGHYGTAFYDVTSGNNDFLGVSGSLFSAGPGYDQASGLGTPIASGLALALCPPPVVALVTPPAQTGQVGHPATLQLHASDRSGGQVTYQASGLPPGLTLSSATGLISGTPTVPGTYTVAVAAGAPNATPGSATFVWTVGARPSITRVSITGAAKRRATLSFRVAAGGGGEPLARIALRLPSGLSFARHGGALTRLIAISDAGGRKLRFSASLSRGLLTLTLAAAAPVAQVRISPPALGTSPKLARQAASRRRPRLTLTVAVIDAGNFANLLSAKVTAF